MQYVQHDFAVLKMIAGAGDPDRDPVIRNRLKREGNAGYLLVRKAGRTGYPSDREAFEQCRSAVEVVQIRVRQEDLINVANAAVPQVWRDDAAGDVGAGYCTGIVE